MQIRIHESIETSQLLQRVYSNTTLFSQGKEALKDISVTFERKTNNNEKYCYVYF